MLAIQGINRRASDADFVLAQLRLSGVLVPEPSSRVIGMLAALVLLSDLRSRNPPETFLTVHGIMTAIRNPRTRER